MAALTGGGMADAVVRLQPATEISVAASYIGLPDD